jgi:hypothetical protein
LGEAFEGLERLLCFVVCAALRRLDRKEQTLRRLLVVILCKSRTTIVQR